MRETTFLLLFYDLWSVDRKMKDSVCIFNNESLPRNINGNWTDDVLIYNACVIQQHIFEESNHGYLKWTNN